MDQVAIGERLQAAAVRRVNGSKHQWGADGEVAKTAEGRIQASPYVALRSITVEFHEGVLVLRGQVTSFYHKQLAQETVRSVDGVGAIVNVVEVIQGANVSSQGTAAGSVSRYSEGEPHVGLEPKTW